MKILLDENLPHNLRNELPGHDVFTVQYMGWRGIKNGALLALAAGGGFDALVTVDKSVPHQQNLSTLPLAVVVLNAKSTDFDDVVVLVPKLLVALNHLKGKSVTYIQ